MAVIKERFPHFYKISPLWSARDQRFLSAIGLEFEAVEFSFSNLIEFCVENTDAQFEDWKVEDPHPARVMTLAMSFVDHCVRLQKLIKFYLGENPSIRSICENFFHENEDLFAIRRSINHSDTRLDNCNQADHLQPLGGDFSWQSWHEEIGAIDTYYISFGPMVGERFSGPQISTNTKMGGKAGEIFLDNLRFRIYGHEASLTDAFRGASNLCAYTHDRLVLGYRKALVEQGIDGSLSQEDWIPSTLSARLRIEGVIAIINKPESD